MRKHTLGELGDVPVVGVGTWNMERDDRREVETAILAALEAGANHIDTAELYGNGDVELLLAPLLRGRRRDVILTSKVLPGNASYAGTVAACERSLRRLGTDYLDLYLLHWRGPHPLSETFKAFEELKHAGKIRAWGVSNFDADDLVEAATCVNPKQIACNQVLYHLEERTIEHSVVPWCEQHGVAVVAYSPFGSGAFPKSSSTAGRALAEMATLVQATPRQVALAFLTRKRSLLAIPKASKAVHAKDNCAAGALELPPAAITALERAFPLGRWRGLPTL